MCLRFVCGFVSCACHEDLALFQVTPVKRELRELRELREGKLPT
jgi:hypothetical protein